MFASILQFLQGIIDFLYSGFMAIFTFFLNVFQSILDFIAYIFSFWWSVLIDTVIVLVHGFFAIQWWMLSAIAKPMTDLIIAGIEGLYLSLSWDPDALEKGKALFVNMDRIFPLTEIVASLPVILLLVINIHVMGFLVRIQMYLLKAVLLKRPLMQKILKTAG